MPGCGCSSCASPSDAGPVSGATDASSPPANSADAGTSVDGGSPSCPAKPCHHPVNGTCTLMNKNLNFGLRVKVTWQSPTGNLGDLSSCHVTELITYSKIPNPPFGRPDGSDLPESGQTQRIPALPGIPAPSGQAQDTHQHPRSLVRTPLVGGSYHVDQSYDYNCTICGSGWVPFARYVITYTLYENPDKKGEWRFKTVKTGPGGPFESDEKY
jgi:hypothetical protein